MNDKGIVVLQNCMDFLNVVPGSYSETYVMPCAGSALHTHHFVAILQHFFIDVFKTSHSTHHVKNFGLADFFVRKTLQIITF
jgi:hypothetical protein